ncbi:MAG: type IV toxin-antitoxin system AbiEi family antitoxin domain-containing protein [Actinomycetota bacterium]
MKIQDRRELRRRLFQVAGSQSGLFTAAQALKAGYSYAAQKYHVDHGNWKRVDRGIFRLAEWPPERHEGLIRWVLWSGGKGVISHETALSVYDIGDADPIRVDLTVPSPFRKTAPGVKLHRGVLPERDVTMFEGVRISTPTRSLLDTAAGYLDGDQFATAVSDAIRNGKTSRGELLRRADAFGAEAALRLERALMDMAA